MAPICYRDPSHAEMFERLAPYRAELYAETGIQHQPFNTVIQLAARRHENPSIVDRAHRWLLLPDLMGFLLTGEPHYELTEASTTQLMALDDTWSKRAFEIAGWPVPDLAPSHPGTLGGYVGKGIRWSTVGSHDTGSAVCGFGDLLDDEMFLNVGTWSLIGCILDRPNASTSSDVNIIPSHCTTIGLVPLCAAM